MRADMLAPTLKPAGAGLDVARELAGDAVRGEQERAVAVR